MKTAGFTLDDLSKKLRIDLSVVSGNIQDLFRQVIKPKYKRLLRDANQLRKLLLCKEEKESLIKSKIRALTQLFSLVNTLSQAELNVLDRYRAELEDELMDSRQTVRLTSLQDELFSLAL